MKLWNGYGSEHSANMVLIGTFESADKAEEAVKLLEEVTEIARADEAAGRLVAGQVPKDFSDGIMDLYRRTQLNLNYGDPEELLYDYDATREADKVVITTDELLLSAFIKVMLHGGAKIELYSRHEHNGPYGRPTH